jgi:ribose/xylose/arabinose/galactoside ABC-type transport system permease subunit
MGTSVQQPPVTDRRRTASAPARRQPWRQWLADYFILILSIIYFLVLWALRPEIGSSANLHNLLMNMLPLLAVVIGQTIVLITGGIDLSVTSTIAFASVLGASIMTADGGCLHGSALAVPAAIAAMLAVGALVGLFNGVSVAVLGMPPFIVTLATMMFISGSAIWFTASQSIGALPEPFIDIWYGSAWFIPRPLLIIAVVAAAAHLLLGRTVPGQWLYAVGMNPKTSRISGVPVRGVLVLAYILCGLCAAVAAILYTARAETGEATMGRAILLDVIGAAVIGGVSLFGGRGKIIWAIFGVVLFTLIANSLNMLALRDSTVTMVKGGIILLAAGFDLVRSRLLGARA